MALTFPFMGITGCGLSVQQLLLGRLLTDSFLFLGGALFQGTPGITVRGPGLVLQADLPLIDMPAAPWSSGGDHGTSDEVLATLPTVQAFPS